jgi:hypothetical protein
MPHSYEEIRGVALDVVAGREVTNYPPTQYEHLKLGVAQVLARREGRRTDGPPMQLDNSDSDVFLEVFWELFRQGLITLGLNDANRQFPHFRISGFGQRILANQQVYFFHDVTTYTDLIRKNIPRINDVTLVYLQEAMQSFKASCILSSTVMLGVATEHTFLLMLEAVDASPKHQKVFANVSTERTILQKINKFKNVLDANIAGFPAELKEDLDTHFAGILSIIRNFRNQAGHPTGRIIDREQAYVLLQLFIPYCRKLYQLREFFQR